MFNAVEPEAIQEVAMKILVGYDGSTAARLALQLAGKRARIWGAKIEVVNCMVRKRELEYEAQYLTSRSLCKQKVDPQSSTNLKGIEIQSQRCPGFFSNPVTGRRQRFEELRKPFRKISISGFAANSVIRCVRT